MKTKVRWMNLVVILLAVGVIAAMALIAFAAFGGTDGAALRQSGLDWCAQNGGLTVGGQALAPRAVSGSVTDPRGRAHAFEQSAQDEPAALLFDSGDAAIAFSLPPGSERIVLTDEGGATVFDGTSAQLGDGFAPENGRYTMTVTAAHDGTLTVGEETCALHAELQYEATLVFDIQVRLYLSAQSVSQGDVLLFCADGVRDPAALALTLPFDYTPVFEQTASGCYAYIPFNYMRAAGEYEVTAVYNGEQQTFVYTVTEPEYEVQHLTVSSSTASSTIGNSTAVEDYNDTMNRLAQIADDTIYWTEDFLQPVSGSITTEFGIKRYTNNATTPTRHAGIDIAAAEGTAVVAANSGRVIFADYLQVSGYTVVIEHGMGLHTFYLHMSALDCAEGDLVERGQTIGKVGMTGFASGPHLHFQAQVGSMCISPWYLFDGSSGVYKMREKLG